MRVPDPSIDEPALRALVDERYGIGAAALEFQPVGGDSWSYRAGEWWVSVRRDRQGHSPAAYEAAHDLRESGMAFVLAPEPGRNGAIVQWLGTRPVTVSRYVAGRPIFPDEVTPEQAAAIESMVATVHGAQVTQALPHETFELPFAEQLVTAAARAMAGAEGSGPYGAKVTALVRRNRERLASLQAEMRSCQAACRRRDPRFVLTHGEPDRGNVFRAADGRLLLMDWGDLAWGPPERDLVSRTDIGLPRRGEETLLRFYELRWILGEIAEYVDRFVGPHTGDAEDQGMWQELLLYLPER